MKRLTIWLCITALFVAVEASAKATQGNTDEERQTLFDFGWKFIEGDLSGAAEPAFDDKEWQTVDLPHDWDISHAPVKSAASGNDGGYYPGGVGWYRKTFKLPAMGNDATIALRFDGVYQNSTVYINGRQAARHDYGYTGFTVDATPFINRGGENTVAVRVDNSQQPNCRWYTGSGIYRHVWLLTASQLHFATDGIYVTTPVVKDGQATVEVTVTVTNDSPDSRTAQVTVEGLSQEVLLAPGETRNVVTTYTIDKPRRWSPSAPSLYQAHVALKENGRTIDSRTVRFGIRTFSWSATSGFVLNGQPVKINGACLHHDNGVLGAAAFDAAEVRKVKLMKEAGFNLIRTAHNPPSPAFLDACDSLGMLVIDEAFDGWRTAKTRYDYALRFDSCHVEDVKAMVMRDRNHPSIISWSIGNEVIERKDIRVITTARHLKEAVRQCDPHRPVTEALCSWDSDWEIYDPHAEVLDIVGYNYMMHKHASDHQRDPLRVMWQTESYPRDAFLNWSRTVDNSYIIGDIVWTGLDYLGEAGIGRSYYEGETPGEHYQGKHFPWHGAYCGDVDLTGWRKPISHYRDLLWNGNAHTLYMAVREPDGYNGVIKETQWSVWPTWESWNWPGHEGKPITVEVCTKAAAVSLYLNNRFVERKTVDRSTRYQALFTLPYQPGTLRAVATDELGNVTATATLSTAGAPAAISLTPDRQTIAADGQDLAFIVMEVVDRDGHVVPDAAVEAEVRVSGQGTLLAAASANLQDVEPVTSARVTTWHGRAIIVVRSQPKAGQIVVTARALFDKLPTGRTKVKIKPMIPRR